MRNKEGLVYYLISAISLLICGILHIVFLWLKGALFVGDWPNSILNWCYFILIGIVGIVGGLLMLIGTVLTFINKKYGFSITFVGVLVQFIVFASSNALMTAGALGKTSLITINYAVPGDLWGVAFIMLAPCIGALMFMSMYLSSEAKKAGNVLGVVSIILVVLWFLLVYFTTYIFMEHFPNSEKTDDFDLATLVFLGNLALAVSLCLSFYATVLLPAKEKS